MEKTCSNRLLPHGKSWTLKQWVFVVLMFLYILTDSWLLFQVTDDQRQQAKQICYGMIYGIGAKSLGEQLGIVEEEAAVFLADFKDGYPGVKSFMDATLTRCKREGFVETMFGRRRYLPKINDTSNMFSMAAAERQAVNTTVQGWSNDDSLPQLGQSRLSELSGSAADLVKTAMNKIEKRIYEAFPSCRDPLRLSNRHQQRTRSFPTEGAFFLLQMHDELVYEVAAVDVVQVARIIKMVMENSCNLSVKTPIKIKVGPSWGTLQEMKDLWFAFLYYWLFILLSTFYPFWMHA